MRAGSCHPASLCFVLSFLVPTCAARATTRYVPAQFPSIQAGIDASSAGDTVLIACGRYWWGGEDSGDPATGLIRLKSGITVRSVTGLPECVTIDAEARGRVFWCDGVDDARLEGITIANGRATGPWPVGMGGAIWCARSSLAMRA